MSDENIYFNLAQLDPDTTKALLTPLAVTAHSLGAGGERS